MSGTPPARADHSGAGGLPVQVVVAGPRLSLTSGGNPRLSTRTHPRLSPLLPTAPGQPLRSKGASEGLFLPGLDGQCLVPPVCPTRPGAGRGKSPSPGTAQRLRRWAIMGSNHHLFGVKEKVSRTPRSGSTG